MELQDFKDFFLNGMAWGKGKREDCSDFTACCFTDLYHSNYQYVVMFGLKEDSKSRLHIPTAVLKF